MHAFSETSPPSSASVYPKTKLEMCIVLDISQNYSPKSIAKEVMTKSCNNLKVSYFSFFFLTSLLVLVMYLLQLQRPPVNFLADAWKVFSKEYSILSWYVLKKNVAEVIEKKVMIGTAVTKR